MATREEEDQEVFEAGFRTGWSDAIAWIGDLLDRGRQPYIEDIDVSWSEFKKTLTR